MNHYHAPASDQNSGSLGIAQSSEDVLQNFLRIVGDISRLDTLSLATDILSSTNTAREENRQLEAKLASAKQSYDDLEAKNQHTYAELVKTCNNLVAQEKSDREEVQTRLSQLMSTMEKEQRATTEASKANTELKRQNQNLVSQRQDEIQKVARAESKIQSLESKIRLLEEKNEKQQASLKIQGSNITSLKAKLKTADDATTEARHDFDNANTRLQQIKRFSCSLVRDDLAADSAQFTALWQECLRVVTACFQEGLPVSNLRDPAAWSALKNASQHTHATPLPQSNSPAAKQMRTMIVLANLSQQLTDVIFAPSYLPTNETTFTQILIDMAADDAPKEQFLRGIMLSAIDETRQADLMARRSRVVDDVVKLVEGLVGRRTTAVFAQEVRRIVDTAAGSWHTFETRAGHLEVAQEGLRNWGWRSLQFNDAGVQLAEQMVSETNFQTDDKVLVVFPRVYAVDGATDVPVFPGVVLQKSQTAAARRENVEVTVESQGRGGSRRMRTPPPAAQQGVPASSGGFLGQAAVGT